MKQEVKIDTEEKHWTECGICGMCGKKIRWFELGFQVQSTFTYFPHHGLGCSYWARGLVLTLQPIKLLLMGTLGLIGIIIYPFIILKRVLFRENCGGW